MSNATAQAALASALALLIQRRASTVDDSEKTAISARIDGINSTIALLDAADLMQAANAVSQAADGLEQLLGAAKAPPFGHYLGDLQALIDRLHTEVGELHGTDKLAAAPVPMPMAPAAAAPAAPSTSTDFAQLKAEYASMYDAMKARPERQAAIDFCVSRLVKSRAVYAATGGPLGIPWYFVGILHGMECGFNFATHLHNGDPLTARTVHVPAGRPVAGQPPFTWQESAVDALRMKGYDKVTGWSIPLALFLFEKYNGMGYRALKVPSPYLWSFSDRYTAGKFVADHQFDPKAVSQQCGAAVMLKQLDLQNLL